MSKKYTKDHEWIEQCGDNWRVGITDYAQQELGDVVAVELPQSGRAVQAGEECMAVESVKAASDIYSPASGTIAAVNNALSDEPALVNESPEGDGWLFELTLDADAVAALDELMDAKAYQKFTEDA